ncbi:hypothetical protein SDC9_170012 [bioreactor metagenome]|uniref:Uncharacterized protein n=1 Tax=bioreactor metagenome TaxID=1076179 RepID=A0A645GA00_9ZZZZ
MAGARRAKVFPTPVGASATKTVRSSLSKESHTFCAKRS